MYILCSSESDSVLFIVVSYNLSFIEVFVCDARGVNFSCSFISCDSGGVSLHLASFLKSHLGDVIKSAMASEITGVSMVCSTVCSDADQRKHQVPRPRRWLLWGEFTGDRWIPLTKASNAENGSIWWRHHELSYMFTYGRNSRHAMVQLMLNVTTGHSLQYCPSSRRECFQSVLILPHWVISIRPIRE